MNLKSHLISFVLLCFTISSIGQVVKMEKVTTQDFKKEEKLEERAHTAEFLHREYKVFYTYHADKGFELNTEVHERLKISGEQGFGYATKEIPLYVSNDYREAVSSIKGTTYNLVNGKLEKTKLSKDGIFQEEVSEFRDKVKIVMPNVRKGSIVEYEYIVKSPFVYKIDEIPVQDHIPVKNLYIKVRIPEYFVYRPIIKGHYPINLSTSTQRMESTFSHNEKGVVSEYGQENRRGFQRSSIVYNEIISEIELQDVAALIEEPFVDNIENYQAAVNFEISALIVPGRVHENFSTSWEDVARVINNHPRFYNELRKTSYFNEDIDELLEGVEDVAVKAQKILNFVKSKVSWNGYYGVLTNKGCSNAYTSGQGNISEVNLMLTAMLNYAGIEAHPVLLSTRDHGIPILPSVDGFNYVITAAKIKDQFYFIDSSEPLSGIGVLPLRAMNWNGRIIYQDGNSKALSLAPRNVSKEMYRMQVSLQADGSVEGQVRGQFTEQTALNIRNSYYSGTPDSYRLQLEAKYPGIEVINHKLDNGQHVLKPLIESFEFKTENIVNSGSDKLYFSPLFQFELNENPFRSENRKYPVDFGFPLEQVYMINILLPDGYKIEHLPKPKSMALPGNVGIFEYNINANDAGNSMNLHVKMQRNTPIIPPQQYELLKEFYRQIVEKETEKVVLSKIPSNEHTERAAGGR